MREATRLTRSGNLQEATQMIQKALRNTPQTPAQTPKNNGQTPAAALPITPLPTGSYSRPLNGEFVQGSHTAGTLTRRYKLYTPPSGHGKSLPLVDGLFHSLSFRSKSKDPSRDSLKTCSDGRLNHGFITADIRLVKRRLLVAGKQQHIP